MTMFYVIWGTVFGFGIGLLTKGINININHKEKDYKQEGYNESMAKYLPPEVQNYYQSTKGQNRF